MFSRYGGHVPSIKFVYGETFGNATSRYFQQYRSRSTPAGKRPLGAALLASVGTAAVRTHRDQAHRRAVGAASWSRCDADFGRQMALKTFGQGHRARYNGQTAGSSEGEGHFILPVKESDRFPRDLRHKGQSITSSSYLRSLPAPRLCGSHTGRPHSGEVRRFQTLPSGIRSSLDERVIRDVFFQRR
ncbi:unnamed protein product [Merluccius merluccius]